MRADPLSERILGELYRRQQAGIRWDLARFRGVLADLGNPQRRIGRCVHIAGTNGKGSTAHLVARQLQACSIKTGLFTSPHLCRFSDRIQIDGESIPNNQLARLLDAVSKFDLTFFETAAVIAFLWFSERAVDVSVVETGLGGRLDATSVVEPSVSVITRIGLDHCDVLGGSLESIAREKAGIMRRNVPVMVDASDARALSPIVSHAAKQAAPIEIRGRDFDVRELRRSRSEIKRPARSLVYVSRTLGVRARRFDIELVGNHQHHNVALAIRSVDSLLQETGGGSATWEKRRQALATVGIPGRMERIGTMIVDVAHNPQACRTVAEALPAPDDWQLVFGCLADKDAELMLAALSRRVSRVWLTEPPSPRACPASSLRKLATQFWPEASVHVDSDLDRVLSHPDVCRNATVVTGSTYLAGYSRAKLLNLPRDPIVVGDPGQTRGVVSKGNQQDGMYTNVGGQTSDPRR